jgi:toxin ParE1/3/4
MATVYKRASAKRDLVEHFVYLAGHAGIETAECFLSSANDSFGALARHPGMGTRLSFHDPKLAELRKWRVNGFEKFLVFYLPRPGRVSIVRVLHAAQDWWGLLGILFR